MRRTVPPCVLALMLGLSALVTGCTSQDNGTERVEFAVDPELVGERFVYERDDFSIRAPRGWFSAPDSLYDIAQQLVQDARRRDPERVPELVAMYMHPGHGGYVAIARFEEPLDDAATDALIEWHEHRLQSAYPTADVSSNRFRHARYDVTQVMLTADEAVVVKLFARRPDFAYQIDYRVPRGDYTSEINAIESSIGSIGGE